MGKLALVLLDFGTVINHFRIHVASSGLIDGLVIAGKSQYQIIMQDTQ